MRKGMRFFGMLLRILLLNCLDFFLDSTVLELKRSEVEEKYISRCKFPTIIICSRE